MAGRRFRYCNSAVLVGGMTFGTEVIVAMPNITAPMSSRGRKLVGVESWDWIR